MRTNHDDDEVVDDDDEYVWTVEEDYANNDKGEAD